MNLWYKLIQKIPKKKRQQLLQWLHYHLAIEWSVKQFDINKDFGQRLQQLRGGPIPPENCGSCRRNRYGDPFLFFGQ